MLQATAGSYSWPTIVFELLYPLCWNHVGLWPPAFMWDARKHWLESNWYPNQQFATACSQSSCALKHMSLIRSELAYLAYLWSLSRLKLGLKCPDWNRPRSGWWLYHVAAWHKVRHQDIIGHIEESCMLKLRRSYLQVALASQMFFELFLKLQCRGTDWIHDLSLSSVLRTAGISPVMRKPLLTVMIVDCWLALSGVDNCPTESHLPAKCIWSSSRQWKEHAVTLLGAVMPLPEAINNICNARSRRLDGLLASLHCLWWILLYLACTELGKVIVTS